MSKIRKPVIDAVEEALTGAKVARAVAKDAKPLRGVLPTVTAKPSRVPVKINDIKPAKENIRDVIESNFISGKLIGDTTMPINSLFGGVGNEVSDIRRVNDLANKISSPNGYVERLIVDDVGNVVEGQHRLDALRKLGIKDVPVTVIRDNTRQFPTFKVEQAVDSAQPMRSDHVNQIVSYLANAFADEGGDIAKLMQYEPPRGYETAWKAGIEAIKSNLSQKPLTNKLLTKEQQ
jgi:hypothetical protein